MDLRQYQIWFVTGSQHLYGEETLRQVEEHSQQIVKALVASEAIPVQVVGKPVVTTEDAIKQVCLEANADTNCVGVVTWMHTFSPAKMWINGLKSLSKPLAHLHTQFNREIPWSTMDMDFMNLNQSAHGDREYGFMVTRMNIDRKVVVGYFGDTAVQEELGGWARTACGWADWQHCKIARFGDNMREVAVTEGDKVEAQLRFGYSVNGFGVGDLVAHVDSVAPADVATLMEEYEDLYTLAEPLRRGGTRRASLEEAARIELGLQSFLQDGGFKGFTTTFENLHGLGQLPGIAVQRLMTKGYGFGAEGDWKTAALVRAMKVMASGLPGGTTFMEDYTYHLEPENMQVLGAHMLEVCESVASGKPTLEIHPLSIGGKEDPVRLVFDTAAGRGINATIIDLGHRFRMITNEVDVVQPPPLPRLPVARALWTPLPDLKTAAAAWIFAGGAHHSGFSQALTAEHLEDFAAMAGIEFIHIDAQTRMRQLRNELRWNSVYYGQAARY